MDEMSGAVGVGASDAPIEPEMSVFEALTPLVRNWRTVLGIPLAFGLAAAVVAILTPVQYTATTSFTTESAASAAAGNLGGLAGLASQFGVGDLLGTTNAELFAEVLHSRELLEATLNSKFRGYDSSRPDSLLLLLNLLEITGNTPLERLAKGVRRLDARVTTHVSKKTGVVTLMVETRPARLAADVANQMVQLLNQFNLERRQLQSREQRRFVEERRSQAEHALRDAEGAQLAFLQTNRTYAASPVLTFEANRLEREVQLRQDLYLTLSRAYEEARAAEVRDTPLLTIIDRAVPPVRHSSPRRALMVVAALLLGGIVGTLRVYVREFRQRAESAQRTDFAEFKSTSALAWQESKTLARRILRGRKKQQT